MDRSCREVEGRRFSSRSAVASCVAPADWQPDMHDMRLAREPVVARVKADVIKAPMSAFDFCVPANHKNSRFGDAADSPPPLPSAEYQKLSPLGGLERRTEGRLRISRARALNVAGVDGG